MHKNIDYSIYLVTDEQVLQGRDFYAALEEALVAGVTLVQLREKSEDFYFVWNRAMRVKNICDAYGVPLIINDNYDLAAEIGAAGVHLGQDDGSLQEAREVLGTSGIIGRTVHSVEEAIQAEEEGADYLGAGAVYATASKADVTTLGLEKLAAICQAVQIPVVGIGGINQKNAPDVLVQGAKGVAVISSILGAENITQAVEQFKK